MSSTERERKEIVGWKGTSDRCKNCTMFKDSVYSQPPMVPGGPGLKHEPSRCLLHDFKTYPTSWCPDHERFPPRSQSK